MSASTITGGTISGSEISGGKITGATIEGNTIKGGTVSGTTITGTTISGNTISGGTISGTTVSGGKITGAVIEGGSISGTNIYGVASHPSDWASGTYYFDVPSAFLVFTCCYLYNDKGDHWLEAEEHLGVVYIQTPTILVTQLHGSDQYDVSIAYVGAGSVDGTTRISVTTSGQSYVGIWVLRLG